MSTRVCDACKRELPLTRFKPSGSGRYRSCRPCFTAKMRARWSSPPATLNCTLCGQATRLADCVRDDGKPYGRRKTCKRCFRERYHWASKTEYQRQRYAERLRRVRLIRRLHEERIVEAPRPKMFKTQDFMLEAEHLASRGRAEAIAEALRLAALRGIWEGYDRAMRSFHSYGPPPDVLELRNALLDLGVESSLVPPLAEARPKRRKRRRMVDGAMRALQAPGEDMSLASVEREAMRRALLATRGNVSEAAKLLGLSRGGLYNLLRRHGRPRAALCGEQGESDPLEAEVDAVLAEAI